MDFIQILIDASIVVKLVLLTLFFMSLYVWILIFAKYLYTKRLISLEKKFHTQFKKQPDLFSFYKTISEKSVKNKSPLETIFISGFKEYIQVVKSSEKDVNIILHYINCKMKHTFNTQMDIIESRASMLATMGSSAPYIGLFGTVWGIIDAFQALALIKHATLTLVAPGISEALIATAAGLFVAIPAVIGYNRFQSTSDQLASHYENFIEDFKMIIEKQARSILSN